MGRDWGYEGGFNVVVVCYGEGGAGGVGGEGSTQADMVNILN